MKEQIEQVVAVSIAKKLDCIQAENVAAENEKLISSSNGGSSNLLKRWYGTISLAWNKLG